MIIACPACSTRYVVPDSAIGIEGRTVRCAKCKHSWFQDGPDVEHLVDAPAAPPPAPAPAPPPPPPPTPPVVDEEPDADESTDHQDFSYGGSVGAGAAAEGFRSGPDFDETEPPYGDVQDDLPPPPEPEEDDYASQFDHAPPFKPRRNITKLWTYAAAIFALVALGTVAALQFAGVPEWMPMSKPLFGAAQPDLELSFPVEQQERRTLPNGTEFFGARIIVKNTARETRNVPPILIVLRDQRERRVYSWVVNPPQPTLAPGEEMTINEAVTDVPKSAVYADIGWAPRGM